MKRIFMSKSIREESIMESVGFYIDSTIIAVDEKDLLHIEGFLNYDNEITEECIVKIPKLDFLFLQSQFFDFKKKSFIKSGKEYKIHDGLIFAGLFEVDGTASMLDEEAMQEIFFESDNDEEELNFDPEEFDDDQLIYKDIYSILVKRCELNSEDDE